MISVDCSFPGGNIIVDGIDGTTIRVHQDVRDTEGDWFWFYFRVNGHEGRKFTVQFTKSKIIGVRGPAVSDDGGANWRWLGAEAVRDNCEFDYQVADVNADLRFAFGIPYTQANLDTYLARQPFGANFDRRVLGKTEKGRDITALRLGRLDGASTYAVLLVARHHCCEATPSFTIEGVIDSVLGSSAAGVYLRNNAEFLIVPFMDLDGVEGGDQGKNRKPYDHNRDYAGESIYSSVRTLRQIAPDWVAGRRVLSLDLHCPWIRGPHNECIYFVGSPEASNWSRVNEFSRVLQQTCRGDLPFRSEDDLPFGQAWNTYPGPQKTFGRWSSELKNALFGTTIEIPYANVRGAVVMPQPARAFGADLAAAIAQYLQTNPPPHAQV